MIDNKNFPAAPPQEILASMDPAAQAASAVAITENAAAAGLEIDPNTAAIYVTALMRTCNETLADTVRGLSQYVEAAGPNPQDPRTRPMTIAALEVSLLYGDDRLRFGAGVLAYEIDTTSAAYNRDVRTMLHEALGISAAHVSLPIAEQIAQIHVYPDASLVEQKAAAIRIDELARGLDKPIAPMS